MPNRWPDVRRRRKNGQNIGHVIRMCKTRRTSRGEYEELKNFGRGYAGVIVEGVGEGRTEFQGNIQEWDATASTQKSPWT